MSQWTASFFYELILNTDAVEFSTVSLFMNDMFIFFFYVNNLWKNQINKHVLLFCSIFIKYNITFDSCPRQSVASFQGKASVNGTYIPNSNHVPPSVMENPLLTTQPTRGTLLLELTPHLERTLLLDISQQHQPSSSDGGGNYSWVVFLSASNQWKISLTIWVRYF